NTASGTGSWSYALAAGALSHNFPYAVRSQPKDSAINKNVQGTPASVTFTYDTTPPTSSISFPASGAFYNAAGWSGGISGSASGPNANASGLSSVGVSIQLLNDNQYRHNRHSCPTPRSSDLNTASGTGSWSYALA